MVRIQVHDKRVICSNPTSPFRYFAWPTVKRLPDGTLVSPPLEDLAPFLDREELKSIMKIPMLEQ